MFARFAVALMALGVGAGTLVTVWVSWMVSAGYTAPGYLIEALGRYVHGDIVMALGIAVGGPLLEEILFRGLLLTALLWFYRPWVAVTGAALLFAALHLNVIQFVPAVLMGLTLGVVYERTGSLVLCWLGHAAYNAQVGVSLALLGRLAGWNDGFPRPGAADTIPSTALWIGTSVFVVGLLALVRAMAAQPAGTKPGWRPIPTPIEETPLQEPT